MTNQRSRLIKEVRKASLRWWFKSESTDKAGTLRKESDIILPNRSIGLVRNFVWIFCHIWVKFLANSIQSPLGNFPGMQEGCSKKERAHSIQTKNNLTSDKEQPHLKLTKMLSISETIWVIGVCSESVVHSTRLYPWASAKVFASVLSVIVPLSHHPATPEM